MANKNVNILLKLQDQFTRPMRQAGVITREQEKSMRRLSQTAIGFSRNVRSAFVGGVGHALKFGAALSGITGALSVGALKSFASQSEELAKAQIEAETKLEAVLGNVKSIAAGGTAAIQNAKDQLMGVASDIQKVGVIGDEVTLAGMQQLATFQLSSEQIAKLSTGMTDLLAQTKGLNATQQDAVSVANLIGKAMNGNAGALTKVGIIMTDNQKKMLQTGDATQRAGVLAEILADNVGGVNAALADTAQGKLQQFSNNWGDMKEEVGKNILDLKAEIAGNLVGYIPKIQEVAVGVTQRVSGYVRQAVDWVKNHSDQIKSAVLGIRDGVATAWGYIKPVLGFAVQHARTLIPAVLGVVGAISAVSVVADVANKVHQLHTAFKDIKTAAGVLHDGLGKLKITGFNPVLLIIGAVIAAGVLLYKHWDVIKPKLIALKDAFVSAFTKVRDVVTGVFEKIKSIAMPILDAIKTALEKIKGFIDTVKTGLGDLGFGSGSSWGANPGSFQNLGGKATGTPYWRGGPTYVNEGRRGEIINLPSGTQIIPHDVSMATAQSGGGRSVTVNVNIAGNVIGNREYADQLSDYICRKLLNAMEVTA